MKKLAKEILAIVEPYYLLKKRKQR